MTLSVESGYRGSAESWSAVLRDVSARGLRAPKLTIADGHLGIWAALGRVYPSSGEQRCWNHKLRNVLDVIARKRQSDVKADLQRIAAATVKEAERLKREFRKTRERAYPKAVERLERGWEWMVTYYAFPKGHWTHIRTTNVAESPFAAVRLRTGAAKRFKKVENATALIWKMLLVVEQHFRKLNAPHLLSAAYNGIEYTDGIRVRAVEAAREQLAA
ncbi:MAG TPA: transposase [Candidatus Elarobacter sp.]|nr:transposase [Candidatus Elarobacter sp.]